MAPMAMRVTEMGASEGCPVIGQIEVASPLGEQMHEAKQMTTGQPVGAASHTTVIPPPCESAASPYRVGLLRFASGCVLVFHGGVFECSSRLNGKPSSPVLRGLGASNGARPLDN